MCDWARDVRVSMQFWLFDLAVVFTIVVCTLDNNICSRASARSGASSAAGLFGRKLAGRPPNMNPYRFHKPTTALRLARGQDGLQIYLPADKTAKGNRRIEPAWFWDLRFQLQPCLWFH